MPAAGVDNSDRTPYQNPICAQYTIRVRDGDRFPLACSNPRFRAALFPGVAV
jgi:hypothetical protein